MLLSNRAALVLVAVNGLLAVGFGAFAAHGLNDPAAKELIRTGAFYQLTHAAAGAAAVNRSRWSTLAMQLGGLIFAGSLYALAFGAPRVLGLATPVGGILMIAGWAVLLATALHSPESSVRKVP
ncbi:MAG: DUF423 domain-containing protein [Proteobacteria bacterium]|nr:DUF423 domain-containing protein [Pseudomonadota bacterium]